MSDRDILIDMETRPAIRGREPDRVRLYMDGESGTWRLFVDGRGNSDFTLATLRAFSDRLLDVLADVQRDPEGCNAEIRAAAWRGETTS